MARVGPGCTWGEVYAWLEESRLSVIGGRDQQVGLGGFLTGGTIYLLYNTILADTVRCQVAWAPFLICMDLGQMESRISR